MTGPDWFSGCELAGDGGGDGTLGLAWFSGCELAGNGGGDGTPGHDRLPACDDSTDAGLATVFGCLGSVIVLVMTALAVHLTAAVNARHRAEMAADLGALAGASWALRGQDAACGRAANFVVANGGALTSCSLSGLDVFVQAQVSARVLGFGAVAVGRARAGPADDEWSG